MFVLFSIIGNNPERFISNSTGQRPVEAGDKYFTRLKALKWQNKAAALSGLSRINGLRFVGLRPTLMLKGRWPFGGMKRDVFILKTP